MLDRLIVQTLYYRVNRRPCNCPPVLLGYTTILYTVCIVAAVTQGPPQSPRRISLTQWSSTGEYGPVQNTVLHRVPSTGSVVLANVERSFSRSFFLSLLSLASFLRSPVFEGLPVLEKVSYPEFSLAVRKFRNVFMCNTEEKHTRGSCLQILSPLGPCGAATVSSWNLPGIPRNPKELPGTARNYQELPGTTRNYQELSETTKNCQGSQD